MAQKPSVPKGTRDFSPAEVARRNYIMQTIKHQFGLFGFQPIETPSFENSSTLMGKYGEEGDRLIFKILNSGDFIKNSTEILKDGTYVSRVLNEGFFSNFYKQFLKEGEKLSNNIQDSFDFKLTEKDKLIIESNLDSYIASVDFNIKGLKVPNEIKEFLSKLLIREFKILLNYTYDIVSVIRSNGLNFVYWESLVNRLRKDILNSYYSKKLSGKVSEKALRYDLTVPFARYVVQHQNEIDFPFKRYQMQPVWRADRPQKGRFREFYQCDADVVGSTSLWQEVDFVQLYDAVFSDLKLEGVTIKMNNRKILSGFAEVMGAKDKLIDFTVALDKLDKIGEEKVKTEMLAKGISEVSITKMQPLFELTGTNQEKLEKLGQLLSESEEGTAGVKELQFIFNSIEEIGLKSAKLDIDVTLARGLNYYTGAIFEVAAPEGVSMGSIGGGGRYDDLTGIFGLKNISGVGISFGLDRIYLVLEELGLFPESVNEGIKALFINFGEKEALYATQAIAKLRAQGIRAALYPDTSKMKKQMQYANNTDVAFTVLVGEQELNDNKFTLKNMKSGQQETVDFEILKTRLKES